VIEPIEPIEIAFTVPCSPEHAFDVWTARTSMWWPTSHSVTGDPDLTVTIEPRVGGRLLERTPAGEEHVWGEVLAWDPPASFTYRWHLNQEVADATEVTIGFQGTEVGTEVRIVHGGWERLGDRGPGLQERNRHGWDGVLPGYRAACSA
jgi:hypothetical protein